MISTPDLTGELAIKLEKLKNFFRGKNVLVAFSGGVDSTLLAYISQKHATKTVLVTNKSALQPLEEMENAECFAREYSIPHVIIEIDPLKNIDFVMNPKNRCYICKKNLYEKLIEIKEKKGLDIIVDGTNMDDVSGYRPGYSAIQELKIDLPYIECGLTKQHIRLLSKYFNLPTSSKPSMACYASRIPYDNEITEQKIEMVRNAESFLRKTFSLTQLRVRLHENNLARIELLPEEMEKALSLKNFNLIKDKFKDLGFTYITLDIEGFRSGSLDEFL